MNLEWMRFYISLGESAMIFIFYYVLGNRFQCTTFTRKFKSNQPFMYKTSINVNTWDCQVDVHEKL